MMKTEIQIVLVWLLLTGCAGPERQMPDSYTSPSVAQPVSQPQRHDGEAVPRRPVGGDRPSDLLALLEGCKIVADDGQFLGVISQNQFATDSILNEFGRYGSEFSGTSIFNEFGRYGSEFSRLSPFNEFTTTPPRIITPSGELVGYLTKNQFKTPSIDPHLLMGLLKSAK